MTSLQVAGRWLENISTEGRDRFHGPRQLGSWKRSVHERCVLSTCNKCRTVIVKSNICFFVIRVSVQFDRPYSEQTFFIWEFISDLWAAKCDLQGMCYSRRVSGKFFSLLAFLGIRFSISGIRQRPMSLLNCRPNHKTTNGYLWPYKKNSCCSQHRNKLTGIHFCF